MERKSEQHKNIFPKSQWIFHQVLVRTHDCRWKCLGFRHAFLAIFIWYFVCFPVIRFCLIYFYTFPNYKSRNLIWDEPDERCVCLWSLVFELNGWEIFFLVYCILGLRPKSRNTLHFLLASSLFCSHRMCVSVRFLNSTIPYKLLEIMNAHALWYF